MKLFTTCMLYAYDNYTTKRGYKTVKLNPRKARIIRFNQKVRDFFSPMMKVFRKKNNVVFDEDIIVL